MNSFVAYTRVLTAETLLLAGLEKESLEELFLALPVIETEGLTAEAEASTWLLRQAIQKSQMSPAMLRQFRERLALQRVEHE